MRLRLVPTPNNFRRIFVASWARAPAAAEKFNAFNPCKFYAALHNRVWRNQLCLTLLLFKNTLKALFCVPFIDTLYRPIERGKNVPRRGQTSEETTLNMELSRRRFLAGASAGLAGTTIGALGFGGVEAAYAAAIRPFKLVGTSETRNTCTYCSVACGIIMYSKGNLAKGEQADIVHIEGDVDHPTNRGTLCPKGAALLDIVHAETRLKYPMVRKPGSDKFERVTWDYALDRIARLMKDDRDKNFIAKNADGTTVNRWISTGFLAASATTNETAWATYKVVRSAGMLVFDNQARV
jgi:formate dehydrogenase major subunit